MYRQILCIFCVTLPAACGAPARQPALPVIDLIKAFDSAEKRPPSGFSIAARLVRDVARPSILAPVPSRLTMPLRLPRRAALRVALAVEPADPSATVRFRVGISDDRIYEALDEFAVSGDRRNWLEVRTDLSAYAGFQWSLFYRPDSIVWRLVLATDPADGAAARAIWGAPAIVADAESAREYFRRRADASQ
jgi:hypothetical protein